MPPPADDLEYRVILQLVRSLELIDDLVVEAAQDALWFQETNQNVIRLPAAERDIVQLLGARDAYRDGYAMADMLRHLDGIGDNRRSFDALITSLIKVMSTTVGSNRGQWLDWYERMQRAGDASWKKAVTASKTMGKADTINALTDKYAGIDRALDVIKASLSFR
jgi:hypothetical protein